ncbi:MAG: FeoA family protein [Phycisphaerae bacterium]
MSCIDEPAERNSTMDESSAQPLSRVPVGRKAIVVALAGGGGLQNRLISMGLKTGCEVRVIRGGAGTWGPILVALGEARLAIGRGMADRIMVSSPQQEGCP